MATIRNPINPDTIIDLTPALEEINPQYGQYSNSGLFDEQGILASSVTYKVDDAGKPTKMTKLTSRTERDAMALDKRKSKLVTLGGVTIKETGGVHVEDLIGITNGVIDNQSETFQQELLRELNRLGEVGAANYEYLITTATQGKVLDPKDGSTAMDLYAQTGTTRSTFTIDANPTKSIFTSLNALANQVSTLNGYYGNFGTIEVVLGETAFNNIVSHPDFLTMYQLAFTGMGNAALNQPIANGLNAGTRTRNQYGYRREFRWENFLFVTYPQKFYRWNGDAVDIIAANKGWTIVNGINNLYQVKFIPAPYVSTYNQVGTKWTARSTGIVNDTHADVTVESHLIPFMQRPEMSLDITVTTA